MNFSFSAHQDEPGLWQLCYNLNYVDVEQLPMLKRPDLEMLLAAEMNDNDRITCELVGDVENIEILNIEYYDYQTEEMLSIRGEEISSTLKAAIMKLIDANWKQILRDNE
jgi:hypothetical protein